MIVLKRTLESTRELLINSMYLGVFLLIAPALANQIAKIKLVGVQPPLIVCSILSLILVIVFFLRKKLHYRYRTILIMLSFLITGITAIRTYGILSQTIPMFLIILVAAALFLDLRLYLLAFILTTAILVFFCAGLSWRPDRLRL